MVVPAAPFGSGALAGAVARAERENRLVIASSSTQRAGGEANPAAASSVLSVAAIGRSGRDKSTVDRIGGRMPDLAAPGSELISIGPAGPGNLAGSAPAFATGFVAGAAALVRGYLSGLTAAQVRERLIATADPGPPSARAAIGAGMVDPLAAVTAVAPVRPGESGPAIAAPDPALPRPPSAPPNDGLPLAFGVVVAATTAVIIAGLATAAAAAARRRRP